MLGRRLFAAFLALIAGLTPAIPQGIPTTIPPNSVIGRLGVSAGPPQVIPFATIRDLVRPVAERERLDADRTYYVRTDGDDDNTCRGNTTGSACATIQGAYEKITYSLDLNGKTVTIQVADGTHVGLNALGGPVGQASATSLRIVGNTSTPANVVITPRTGTCFRAGDSIGGPAEFYVTGMTLSKGAETSAFGFESHDGAKIVLGTNRIGAMGVAGVQIYFHTGGYMIGAGSETTTLVGAANAFILAGERGDFTAHLHTFNWPSATAYGNVLVANSNAHIRFDSNTLTNKANVTGPRWNVSSGGSIITGTTDPTYLPGDAVGVNDGTGFIDAWDWINLGPITVTSIGGDYTTVGAAHGMYKLGPSKLATGFWDITITTVAGGAGPMIIPLPVAFSTKANNIGLTGAHVKGWNHTLGVPLGGVAPFSDVSHFGVTLHDGTAPVTADGHRITFTLTWPVD